MLRLSTRVCSLILLALACAACGDDEATRHAADAKAQAFTAGQQTWRDERKARLILPDGWTSRASTTSAVMPTTASVWPWGRPTSA